MTKAKTPSVDPEVIQRLHFLAATSIFVQADREATPEEDREFALLLEQCLSKGMRFKGLRLEDDGCALCFEEKKHVVYKALEKGPQRSSGLASVRIDLPVEEGRRGSTVH